MPWETIATFSWLSLFVHSCILGSDEYILLNKKYLLYVRYASMWLESFYRVTQNIPWWSIAETRFSSITSLHLVLLLWIFLIELYSRSLLKKWKEMYDFGDDESGIDEEQYSEYYKRAQLLYVVRITLILIFVLALVTWFNAQSFSYLAIAAWAITIVFGSYIQSFATYFYILSITSVGQTVRTGPRQGDIIRIRPLYISITGRSDNGEHTGELVNIPNYKVWDNPIVNVDLALHSHTKALLSVYFKQTEWEIPFVEFLEKLEVFLSEYLEKPSSKAVYHYKTYRGYAYKLWCTYTTEGAVEVRIGFICQLKHSFARRRAIIEYIEWLRFATKCSVPASTDALWATV